MTHIHLDAVGGIAGDMFVAALLDARPDLRTQVLADATAVLPPGIGRPALDEAASGGLRALRFGLAAGDHIHPYPHDHHHDHDHDSGSFRDMATRIEAAELSPGTADHAIAILRIIAEAEAALHSQPVEDVHFHELADWDSLLDVVAAGSIAAGIGPAKWTVSPLPRGGGLVKTRHGLLPVPAPATAAILLGFDWRDDGIAGERVTPTGAAILKHLAVPGLAAPAIGRLTAVGTGAGTRSLPGTPNILRALVFAGAEATGRDRVTVLSFEIDDMTGEEIATAADRLRLRDGVLDLSIGLRLGKKGRTMHGFRLLVRPEAAEAVTEACFVETSTIGLRHRQEERVVLPRREVTVVEEDRRIGVKLVRRPTESAKAAADDLAGDSLETRRRLKRHAELGAE